MTAKRSVQLGDVFAVRTSHAEGVVGRVVSTTAIVGPTHACNLVYVYKPGSRLARDELLVAPLMTSRAPWSRGYFAFVRSEPLLPAAFFERHCFRDLRGALYDEESRPVDLAFDPLGDWRLFEEVATIDHVIAEALRRL